MADRPELGERIKRARLAKNLTLKEIERKAEVSATHVSEIERGMTSPTVGALERIARALDARAADFLRGDTRETVSVVRRANRPTLSDPASAGSFQRLSRGVRGAAMSVVVIEIDPGHADRPTVLEHRGEQFFHVLHGVVEVTTATGRWVLKEGDSLHERSDVDHALRNIGDGSARIVWSALPPLTL